MKKIILMLALVFASVSFLLSQTVDSIKVEQSGDFVKVRYKILNSRPDQFFRVKVLCSINGGLNTELRSISGDTGDNIVGGKPEYFVVWDVLKDVEELGSAEFIVRAELISDLSKKTGFDDAGIKETERWSKKRINFMLASIFPGPKAGFRLGYLGSFGISGQYTIGAAIINEQAISIGQSEYVPEKVHTVSLNLSKRIVNTNGFQMHLLAGVQRTRLIFRDPNAMITPYHAEKVFGPEVGFAFGIKMFACSLLVTHFDPGQVEKSGDFEANSPLNYVTSCIGIRF